MKCGQILAGAALFGALALAGTVCADEPGLPDTAVPLDTKGFERASPLLELGNPFLATGKLFPGFRLPTGAVWQPTLLLFGSYRSAFQSIDQSTVRVDQWANRLDFFANLALTPTERFVLGMRPLDRRGNFTGLLRQGEEDMKWKDAWNGNLQTLFFEGDFGELFPGLDNRDRRPLDIGFAVGRQPLDFEDGLLVSDSIDALGLTRNTLRPFGLSNLRLTGLVGWNGVDHDSRVQDPKATLFGLMTESDLRALTLDIDLIGVASGTTGGDGFFAGVSAIGRIGLVSTTFRLATSVPLDEIAGSDAGVGRGTVAQLSASWSPRSSTNLLYASAFAAFGRYTSASRDPLRDGPLGNVGILFSGVGMGRYGAVLSSAAGEAAGGALGYQLFFSRNRRQLVFELGGRTDTDGTDRGEMAFAVRLEQAFARRFMLRLDGFLSGRESVKPSLGARSEVLVKF